jgi:hypothetical protein
LPLVSEGYALEPADLDAIVRALGQARTELGDDVRDLTVTPDAGASSDEVAQAFALLATAAGALSERIGTISETLSDNVAAYRASEEQTAGRFAGPVR